MAETARQGPDSLVLLKCPRCMYSLEGLPPAWRCPECGFVYDESTFVLSGISRGMKSTSPHRVSLWLFVGVGISFGPQIFVFGLGRRGVMAVLAALALLWLAALGYLLGTGRRERRGIEKFLFAAGGFGPCEAAAGAPLEVAHMTPWSAVDAVRLDRKSANWYRLRIGTARRPGGGFANVRIDAGVRCDGPAASRIEEVLMRRIEAAKASPARQPSA